jgi:hypothetical protein
VPLWEEAHGRADHCNPEGARDRDEDGDLCRKYGISEANLLQLQVKYGGLEVSEAGKFLGSAPCGRSRDIKADVAENLI